ncbi:MAG: glycosyltransferase [Acetobacter peroxydans]|jgi:glycosyltransferase involved in cell wall biosynthesis|nr:glycosyltransferase [Acetobacter peroxydans]
MTAALAVSSAQDERTAQRLKILVLAESCNPEWFSAALIGWSYYEALSQVADVHLVTRVRNCPALERHGLRQGRDYTAIDTEFLFKPMERLVRLISGPNKGWAILMGLSIPSYLLFEFIAWRRFGSRIRQFDLVHRVTPVSPTVPSPIARWCHKQGVPFILGPLNGGLPWPKEFPDLHKQEGEWFSYFRSLFRCVPGYRSTREAASAIIAGGESAYREIPERWKNKTIYIPENAIDPQRFPASPKRTAQGYTNRPIRAVFLGRLVPYKACDILLEAAADLLREGRMTLTIIGSGPEESRLRALVTELGIGQAVRFTGELPHPRVAEYLVNADILTFPSVHEFGGAVVLEAMVMGVVPVISDYGGPAELASPQCAFLVPLKERAAYIAAYKATLHAIAADPTSLLSLSDHGRQRAERLFTWPRKVEQIVAVYEWAMGKKAKRPDWGMPFRDDPHS